MRMPEMADISRRAAAETDDTLSEHEARVRVKRPMAKSREVGNLNSPGVRVNWQLKAVLPVAFVLVNGIVLFLLATVSLRDPERHQVLIVAGVGAIAVCAVVILALALLIQRPMVELQEKIARVGEGDGHLCGQRKGVRVRVHRGG